MVENEIIWNDGNSTGACNSTKTKDKRASPQLNPGFFKGKAREVWFFKCCLKKGGTYWRSLLVEYTFQILWFYLDEGRIIEEVLFHVFKGGGGFELAWEIHSAFGRGVDVVESSSFTLLRVLDSMDIVRGSYINLGKKSKPNDFFTRMLY